MAISGNTSIVIASLILSVLAIIAVVLRFWARRTKGIEIGLDNYFILPAVVSRYKSRLIPASMTYTLVQDFCGGIGR